MPVVSTTKMTAEQFLLLGEDPPGVRLELVNGEVAVSPSPTPDHSHVVVNLIVILGQHVHDQNLGELHHDVDTILDRFNVRRPDVLYFSNARTHLIGKKAMEGPPDLAVEVISPRSVEVDREDKFEQYREAGVAFYWILIQRRKASTHGSFEERRMFRLVTRKAKQSLSCHHFRIWKS